MKEKWNAVLDKILKNSKFVFPILAGVAVCITVIVAMNLSGAKSDTIEQFAEPAEEQAEAAEETPVINYDAPLVENTDSAIEDLIVKYYNAVADGDEAVLNAVVDEWEEQDLLRGLEMAKYVDAYSQLEIYTKPGYREGETIAFVYYMMKYEGKDTECPGYRAHYVCTDENGNLYLKRSNYTDEENDYIMKVTSQADVVEFNNKVTVEYNELMLEQPELLTYMNEVVNAVQMSVGEILAQQNSDIEAEETEEIQEEENTETEGETIEPVEEIVLYAKTTATVNVRSSDSEKADKLGKAASGTKLQVLEQRVNGWTKVLYEKKEGFIKSEYLELVESAKGQAVIGTVTANTNVNVRGSASESGDRLGVLTAGDSADLLSKENGWCKINYNGQIGFVKEDFVH